MILKLRTKLSMSFVIITLLSVFLISILTNYLLDKQFKDYVKKNQEQKIAELEFGKGC